MFGIKYMKFEPNDYVILYKKGRPVRKGAGISFWYYSASESIIKIPTDVSDETFMFEETTLDFQTVTIQGSVAFRIDDPEKISKYLNFTLKPNAKSYISDVMENLSKKIKTAVAVSTNKTVSKLPLHSAITQREEIKNLIWNDLRADEQLNHLGISVLDLSILGIKPNIETARALEAEAREKILKASDDAIYARRNSSIEQERSVRENEYNTEIAIEEKKREIEERKLKAKQGLQQQQNHLKEQQVQADIILEQKKRELIELSCENTRVEAQAKAYELSCTMQALEGTDHEVLRALASMGMDSNRLIAVAFGELAKKAGAIGQLNVSPDLLTELMNK
ncbi:SPFH domain-containing protein [Filifactor villosus]|uniref:SPFH domain-containing protein n=1 Tax=Filifactor villosus TaxID=29374 RepID=A0ABV9QIB9_9FIRM